MGPKIGMTPDPNEPLRQRALHVLRQRAGTAAKAGALAAAAHSAYDDLARVLAPLIGQGGVDALTGRALHLAQRDYSWLTATPDQRSTDQPFAHVVVSLERQEPAVAAEGAAAVFATMTGLLTTLIGEPLTTRLLRKAWSDAFPDAGTKET